MFETAKKQGSRASVGQSTERVDGDVLPNASTVLRCTEYTEASATVTAAASSVVSLPAVQPLVVFFTLDVWTNWSLIDFYVALGRVPNVFVLATGQHFIVVFDRGRHLVAKFDGVEGAVQSAHQTVPNRLDRLTSPCQTVEPLCISTL
jgi:hypothetical protein